MGDDDEYWNSSSAGGFSWDGEGGEGGVAASLSGALAGAGAGGQSSDTISFEPGVGPATSGELAERVRAAARAVAAAAEPPEPSLTQLVTGTGGRNTELELKAAQRALAKLQVDRWKPAPAQQTAQDFILGRPTNLTVYRSLAEKEALLDAALEWGDGDLVLAVTLHLRHTLKRSKLLALLSCRQEAADHLLAYLLTRLQYGEAVELLLLLDRPHQAGVVACRQAAAQPSLESRARSLKLVAANSNWRQHLDLQLVLDQVSLCERLAPVISAEVGHPGRGAAGLQSASVLRVLLYLATHHHGAAENLLHSPAALRTQHNLTERQWTWVCLRARAGAGAWQQCEELVVGRGWMGGKKAKGSVEPGEVARVLGAAGAPQETLTTVLLLLEDSAARLAAARKLGVHCVVTDCLAAARDRPALLAHQRALQQNSPDWFYAENALNNSNVKWKP